MQYIIFFKDWLSQYSIHCSNLLYHLQEVENIRNIWYIYIYLWLKPLNISGGLVYNLFKFFRCYKWNSLIPQSIYTNTCYLCTPVLIDDGSKLIPNKTILPFYLLLICLFQMFFQIFRVQWHQFPLTINVEIHAKCISGLVMVICFVIYGFARSLSLTFSFLFISFGIASLPHVTLMLRLL